MSALYHQTDETSRYGYPNHIKKSGVVMGASKLLSSLVAMAVAWLVGIAPSYGADTTQYELKIEEQSLGTALQEFAKQSGVQVVFLSRVTDGLAAPEVKGKFTAAGALKLLLSSSELTFRELNPNTIEVRTVGAGGEREGAQH